MKRIECFLTNLYSIDVMAPFCLEMRKRGYECYLALDEMFWKLSYGEQFNLGEAKKRAKNWGVDLKFRLNYDVDIAVTQWRVDWALFGLYKNLKAKMSYGIMINTKTYFAYNDFRFDLYFVHGDFEKDILLSKGIDKKRIVKIGFPKLKHQTINFSILKKEKVLTYLPTWDDYNCIDLFIDKFKNLDYKIYIKPHPLQSNIDLKRLKQFHLLDKDITIKSVVSFSDVIVGDLKSGAIFDALYYNSNIPIFALSRQKFLHEHIDIYKNFEQIITENNMPDLRLYKNKQKIKEYCFNEKFKIYEVSKISPNSNKKEIDLLKERLEKIYNEFYRI